MSASCQRILFLPFLILAIWLINLHGANAQVREFELQGGDLLIVEGKEFIYETRTSTVNGETVLQDVAVWKGLVRAEFSGFILETGHLEAVFDGPEISYLEAGPEVKVTGFGGLAKFNTADMSVALLKDEEGRTKYSGVCNKVHGYYLAYAKDLGLEGTGEYEINFRAESMILEPEYAILNYPELTLGDIDKPDFSIRSRKIRFEIGIRPGTSETAILSARLDNASASIFGVRLNFRPFPYTRTFFRPDEPGWDYPLPKVGWYSDEGPFVDQSTYYNFMLPGFDEGPQVYFHALSFPMDRTYPDAGIRAGWNDLTFDLRAGYLRREDSNGEPVPARVEPELSISSDRISLLDSSYYLTLSGFAGRMKDLEYNYALNRYGWVAALDGSSRISENLTLSGKVNFKGYLYEGGHEYSVLDGSFTLRYVEPPHWGASLIYRKSYNWGLTPFRFDVPDVGEELRLREQTRLSKDWGAGFDWAWDFEKEEFSRSEINLTYIFDSFQVSMGWDFSGNKIALKFALPGSLK